MSIVHRDLKPSNLMITADGKLKLTDFGIAKDLDRTTQLTAPGRTLGTAAYMAPEQIRGTPAVSHKTDLYALGVLLYQMLTGKPPFDGASAVVLMHCHLNEPPPRPSDKVETIPKELDDLVVKLMAKSPADRPWDAAAVSQSLKELRDKADRGEADPHGLARAGFPRGQSLLGREPELRTALAEEKHARQALSPASSRDSPPRCRRAGGTRSRLLNRGILETLALVATLIAIGGFIAYWLWPPSAEYLYRQAADADGLVAPVRLAHRSGRVFRHSGPQAPGPPLQGTTPEVAGQDPPRRGRGPRRNLSSPVKTQFSEPHSNGERQYVTFDTLAAKAGGEGNETMAVTSTGERWPGCSSPTTGTSGHGTCSRSAAAEELETKIPERRAFVIDQLARADAAAQVPAGPTRPWRSGPCSARNTPSTPTSPTCWARRSEPEIAGPPARHRPSTTRSPGQTPQPEPRRGPRPTGARPPNAGETSSPAPGDRDPCPATTVACPLEASLHGCLHE